MNPSHRGYDSPHPHPHPTHNMYPPATNYQYDKPSSPAGHWTTNVNLNVANRPQNQGRPSPTRTPSPTPSEAKELKSGAIDWKTLMNWRFWARKDWIWYYVILTVILVITALVTIFHKQIVEALTPVTKLLHDHSWGWIVPIAVLFVISFPPLFGHEIVAILCGLVWGLWIGFGIVAAGTFFGEVGNFYAFKYCCSSRGEKLERTKLSYACLAKVVRDGGFKIALIVRLSAIPGHFTTAVFSTCGMGIFTFSLAAILSMPKQLITVYLGVILEGNQDTRSKIISDVVLAITFIITAASAWYILRQMNKVKPEIIYQRRKARQAKLARGTSMSMYPTDTNDSQVFNPNGSDSHIPLTASHKNPTEYRVHAPQPQHAINNYGYSKSDEDLESNESALDGADHHRGFHAYDQPRQSTDDVQWETGAYSQAPRKPSFPPPGITPPPQVPYATSQPPLLPSPYDSQVQVQPFSSPTQMPSQPAYVSNSPALTPPRNPYQSSPSPTHGQHAYEPTGMSYHTAYGSESAYDGIHQSEGRRELTDVSDVNVPGGFGSQRTGARSPPPPSYTVDLR
ncbi:hypothetical protein V5O48_008080 [Marasmius crinis-equi]|uniref:Golgi apparatus membrane protein TVP38 n=1 Tax=Marasmius crinis-equi TaxID=585013 RepID=A0ABR3FF14_9AGAR